MIRALTTGDIPRALELSSIAGWNQTAEDWRTLIGLAAESCFAFECDGEFAATTTLICYERRLAWIGMVLTYPAYRRRGFARALICYERRLAWIGMVLTYPAYRRRGFARALMTHALETADRRGIETVKLDATEEGQPLYESLGFVAEQEIERWTGKGSQRSRSASAAASQFPESLAALDLSAFGANRSRLLNSLAARARPLIDPAGYLLRRSGRTASYIGPCVARTPETARRLVQRCLDENKETWLWDLLPANANARGLAVESGFHLQRRLVRMYRGTKLRGEEEMLFGIAGFELG